MEERERDEVFLEEYLEETEDIKAEGRGRRRQGKKRYRLTGSLAAKITAFFLLGISCLVGILAGMLCLTMEEEGFYTQKLDTVLLDVLITPSMEIVNDVKYRLTMGNLEAAEELCRDRNIDIELKWVGDDNREKLLWDTGREYDTKLTFDMYLTFGEMQRSLSLNRHTIREGESYLYRAFINPEFPEEDNLRRIALVCKRLYAFRYGMIALAGGGILLCVVCFVFLMCAAGRRRGREEVVPSVLTGFHLDVLTFLFGVGGVCFFVFGLSPVSGVDSVSEAFLLAACCGAGAMWITLYCMELALRMKLGRFWRHSLVYLALKGLWKAVCMCGRGVGRLIRGIPLIALTLTGYLGVCILEFVGVALFVHGRAGVRLWLLEKIVFLPIIMYIALVCRKLLEASRALAEGQEDYVVDTSRMFGDFREHGENLNSLGQGIARAVAERMKSEHLKTELISNVSHDLKTPLTSIINYADLIYQEASGEGGVLSEEKEDFPDTVWGPAKTAGEERRDSREEGNAKVAEYAEVLLRQSKRLKKLLEDLMEASKAATGNLEVNLEPCEVGVLLSQAVGEYQKRMEEKGLELIARQPSETVQVLADGRHLWRIFDNLLNNVCKYAQENSRVYLSVEVKKGWVLIIFRNMSKYALDISAEELEERFVRGDKSRHMEGNGLGLSIAKSLMDLQNGRMELVVDGDLFKVTLRFPVFESSYYPEAHPNSL